MIKKITTLAILLVFSELLYAQYEINDTFADPAECTYMTRDAFIIWWDNDFDYSTEVDILLDQIIEYRTECLDVLNMMDPPGVIDGYYQNIYLHGDGGYFDDNGWGNGVGTDSNGYPFYTMPYNLFNDIITVAHEIFHLYQYNSNSPGFAYSGDSQWYIEASANWYGARQDFSAERAFIEAESLVRLPHVPFWLSYDNFPNSYPENWQRYVHQYALALFLFYLTEEVGISPNVISEGFYMEIEETPQEFLYNQLGSDIYRNHFIDWAARMTNEFDFITENQRNANEQEWNNYADPEDDNEYTEIFDNDGTEDWYQPTIENTTNAWSYNTYKLENSGNNTYTFEINGNTNGTFDTPSHFQGKLLVKDTDNNSAFYDLEMSDSTTGSLTLNAVNSDSEIYFIIASMPDYFEEINQDFQQFPYQIRITNDVLSSSDYEIEEFKYYPNPIENNLQIDFNNLEENIEIVVVNTLGQKVINHNYSDKNEISIDFSNLEDGIYYLNVLTNRKSNTIKLVKT